MDINPGAANGVVGHNSSDPNLAVEGVLNGRLYFNGIQAGASGLWTTDGSEAGTYQVNPQPPGPNTLIAASEFTTLDGVLYFVGSDSSHGPELWRSDGTAAGTQMECELVPGPDGGFGAASTAIGTLNHKLIFSARGSDSQESLCFYDPASHSLSRLTLPDGTANFHADLFTEFKGSLYFIASSYDADRQLISSDLWMTDGTASGTKLVFADPNHRTCADLTVMKDPVRGDTLFFSERFATYYGALWKTDGITEPVQILEGTQTVGNPTVIMAGIYSPIYLIPIGDTLYYTGIDNTNDSASYHGQELWKYDGTAAVPVGPDLSYTISYYEGNPVNPPDYSPSTVFGQFAELLGKPFFNAEAVAIDGASFCGKGAELYTFDPEGGVPQRMVDIYPGTNSFGKQNSSDPASFTELGGKLYFAATTENGRELWVTDGTATGTMQVADIFPGAGSADPQHLFVLDNTLYFMANDGAHGYELWSYTPSSGKVDANVAITPYAGFYDGSSHSVTGSATGTNGDDFSGLLHLGPAEIDAGHYEINWTFDGNDLYNSASGTSTIDIAKADATISITPYSGTYDGAAHGLTGSAMGVTNEDLSSLLDLGASETNAGHYDVTWSFAGSADYNAASGTSTIDIAQRPITVIADPRWKFVGDADPALTYSITSGSLINGDSFDLTRVPGENAGTYAIQIGDFPNQSNYDLQYNGADLMIAEPSSLQGLVYTDFSNDGVVDVGELGVAGVAIHLHGVDIRGETIDRDAITDIDGFYRFDRLYSGDYTIAETQPTGFNQGINNVGTAGGSASGDVFSVSLIEGIDGLNYNFAELPPGNLQQGQAAAAGFWNNKKGQSLIKSLNGGGTDGHGSQALGDWLAMNFTNMFGANAGANNLTGKDNAYVALFFQQRFLVKGQKLDAQVLATALSAYVTSSELAGNAAIGYGFVVTAGGAGVSSFNVGSDGAAVAEANGTSMTIMQILLAVDAQAVNGNLYNGNATLRNTANDLFSAINSVGGK